MPLWLVKKKEMKQIQSITRGQGVHREVESEGYAEKHRVVIKGQQPMMNRSAQDREWSSLHYGDEGIGFLPVVPRCVRTTRCERFIYDPGRPHHVLGWHQDKRTYKSWTKWQVRRAEESDSRIVPEALGNQRDSKEQANGLGKATGNRSWKKPAISE